MFYCIFLHPWYISSHTISYGIECCWWSFIEDIFNLVLFNEKGQFSHSNLVLRYNWQYISISSDNDSVPNSQQGINWTIVDHQVDHWFDMVSLGHNGLILWEFCRTLCILDKYKNLHDWKPSTSIPGTCQHCENKLFMIINMVLCQQNINLRVEWMRNSIVWFSGKVLNILSLRCNILVVWLF